MLASLARASIVAAALVAVCALASVIGRGARAAETGDRDEEARGQ